VGVAQGAALSGAPAATTKLGATTTATNVVKTTTAAAAATTNSTHSNSSPQQIALLSAAEKTKMVHELCQQLLLTDEQVQELCYRILHELRRGLAKDTHPKANVKCFVTYVQDLPNGNERGKFLALDLGGTNFRVLLIHLQENNDFQMESRIYAIPQHIMIGSGQQLFDHCKTQTQRLKNTLEEKLVQLLHERSRVCK